MPHGLRSGGILLGLPPMRSSEPRQYKLNPHPANRGRAVEGIEGEVLRRGAVLQVSYRLRGALQCLVVPEPGLMRFADGLWRHTCFELFVACREGPAYREFNFSPSGSWASYAFVRYREPVEPPPDRAQRPPCIEVKRTDFSLQLQAQVSLDGLPPDCALHLGLSAVIEEPQSLSYWALAHPPGKPDFHHPDAFSLEFDEIRNRPST